MLRFRLFAGPNGSGKSSLYQYLKKTGIIHSEIYVSADRIEAGLRQSRYFNFNAYRVKTSEEDLRLHISSSGLFGKMKDKHFLKNLTLKKGILNVPGGINSYIASFIATYLVEKLLESKQSFCFETVMSHESKVEMLKLAAKKGYKTYLYFVFTEDPVLNERRVQIRVEEGGHNVDATKIHERFYRSFALLKQALKNSSDAFLIDNSVNFTVVAEQKNGKLTWRQKVIPVVLKKYSQL